MVLAASFIGGNVSMTSSRTVRDFSHRAVEISHRAVNPPTKYKQCIISGAKNKQKSSILCVRYTAYNN
jgi:hypothetical protein